MKKNTYSKFLSCYYAIEDGTHIILGYGEGNDTLRLAIGKRRKRLIENIDVKYLYLIIHRRVNEEYDEYVFSEYRKYEPQFINGEYVVDLQGLLNELHVIYHELDSKEFSKIKKLEEPSPCEYIYPYAYGQHRYWDYANADFIRIKYCKNAFMIGNREVDSIYGELFTRDRERYKFLMETCEKKIEMDEDSFIKFLEIAKCMNVFSISSGDVAIEKNSYGDLWTYTAWLENDGSEEYVTYSTELKERNAGVILYNLWKCRDYEQYKNLVTKMKFLGLG